MKKHLLFIPVLLLVCLCSCEKILERYPELGKGNPLKHYSNQVILDWNLAVVEAMGGITYTHGPLGARMHAMTHIAMHDALNAIVPAYDSYALAERDHAAEPIAAAATAAYTVLVNSLPDKKAVLDARLAKSLANVKEGERKTRGIALGKKAAQAILDLRKDDGAFADPIGKVEPSDEPGVYQDEFAFVPFWRTMQLFSMVRHDQFRSGPPPALNSASYTKSYNEIKSLGKKGSPSRTANQTAIAYFWYELGELGWNRIARTTVGQAKPNLLATARLFALLNIALADGYTAGWDTKFHYNFWRPFKAIQYTKDDGNPATEPEAGWQSLMPTPPIPEYPSTHAALGNAAATVLAAVLGNNTSFTTTSSTAQNQGEERSFSSFSQAANENAESRVTAGIHFRFSIEAGQEQGNRLGQWVIQHTLQPQH